jgi:hypothetical protein
MISLSVTLPKKQRTETPEAVVWWSRGREVVAENNVKRLVQEPAEIEQ